MTIEIPQHELKVIYRAVTAYRLQLNSQLLDSDNQATAAQVKAEQRQVERIAAELQQVI